MTRPPRTAPAFTIVEMLVAVAAVTLIALGVAQVFTATGATVRVGKRISSLNERAAVVEHQMRQDIARMTRGGFLVIRNQDVYSDEPGEQNTQIGPRISADDNRVPAFRRPRRVDELMFFAEGQFESQRERVDPSRAAVSSSARIWYGHGLRQSEVDAGGSPLLSYFRPEVTDPPDAASAPPFFASRATRPIADNPNYYAANWTLLRHVTVLSPPSRASEILNTTQPGLNNSNIIRDSAIQIGLQPAASSIFRNLATSPDSVNAMGVAVPPTGVVRFEGTASAPKFTSGLVDIAATDLSEIRSIVLDGKEPVPNLPKPYSLNLIPIATPRAISFAPDVDSAFKPDPDPVGRVGTTSFMKQWMARALPADSDGFDTDTVPPSTATRIRYEPDPPDLVGTVGPTPFPTNNQLVNSVRRADQQMLTSSNFVPACTEFIVEWSFGETVPSLPISPRSGQLIWHGLPRFPRVSDPSVSSPPDTELEVRPYTNTPSGPNSDTHWLRYARRDGVITQPKNIPPPDSTTAWRVPAALVHWIPNGGFGKSITDNAQWQGPPTTPWPRLLSPRPSNAGVPLYSMFGYVDPTFDPQSRGGGAEQPDTIPWAWPRLIRVTMSLVDPADPTVEETFQFVFEVPRGSGLAN